MPWQKNRDSLEREITNGNDEPRGGCTPPWWLTVEVKSLPREEMFEILDSGRTGSASCLSGDDTSEWLVAVDGGEI
jgi:hypothetical protein